MIKENVLNRNRKSTDFTLIDFGKYAENGFLIASVVHILTYVIADYKIKQKDPDDKIWNYRGNACNQITATFACLIYILTTIAYFNSGYII